MATLFPFAVDWSTTYKVTRSFKTDIITSRSGKEQRRALRNRPRKTVEFQVSAFAEKMRLFNRQMGRNQGVDLILPDYSRSVLTTTAMGTTDASVGISMAPAWLQGPVVIGRGKDMEVRTALAETPSTLTFTAAGNAWPVGTPIFPGLTGRLANEVSTSWLSDGVSQASITFNVSPTTAPEIDPAAATLIYNGREVVLLKPNWAQSPSVTHKNPYESVDYDYGAVAYFNPIAFSSRATQATFLALSPSQVQVIEDIFSRAKGQRGEFYMPTGLNDLPLMAAVGSFDTTFTTPGSDVQIGAAADTVYRRIAISLTNGTTLLRAVQSIASAGANSLVQVDSAFGVAFDPTTVTAISWMPCCRFTSDALTTEWVTDQVAQLQLSVVTLEDLPADVAS